jgi:hypothetical protein
MSLNLRSIRILAVAAAGCLAFSALAGSGSASAADPVLRATKTCKPPRYPGSGYFTELRVTNVSCTYGKEFVLAYRKCRIAEGGIDGRCRKRVRNFTCTERRTTIPTEIDARVTCRRGTQRIVHSYQQNIE